MEFRTHAGGTWVVLGTDPNEPDKPTRLRLRPIPRSVEMAIDRKRGFRAEGMSPDKFDAMIRDKAKYALLDSENFVVFPETKGDAEAFAKVLGSDVDIDEPLSLDGHWSPDLLDAVLERVPLTLKVEGVDGKEIDAPLDLWILKRAKALGAIDGEREEALGKA